MNLKKSDKMIAIIGVVILIVAAISIVYYVSTEDEVREPTEEEKIFEVKWIPDQDFIVINELVGKEGYEKNAPISALKPGSVITNVDVKIDWEDTNKLGKILNKGEDTITADITIGGETKTHKDTGKGNETLQFTINSIPDEKIIKDVESKIDAELLIENEYAGMDSVDYNVKVTWEKGENFFTLRLRKFLNFLFDKGDTINIKIIYDYYYPEVDEVENDGNNNDGNPPTGGYQGTPYNSLLNTGFH